MKDTCIFGLWIAKKCDNFFFAALVTSVYLVRLLRGTLFIKIDAMAYSQSKFDKAVWNVVSNLASGRVMSYGEVARAAGYPRHARMVSRAMGRSPESLPWYRIVRSNRTLAFEAGSEFYNKQQCLLEKEGVKIIAGKVIPVHSDGDKNLDELLWGPSE